MGETLGAAHMRRDEARQPAQATQWRQERPPQRESRSHSSTVVVVVVAAFLIGVLASIIFLATRGRTTTPSQELPKQETQANTKADAIDPPVVEQQSDSSSQDESSSASPDRAPQATLDEATVSRVNDDLAQVASGAGMQVGVSVIDLPTGTAMGYQADAQMASASMIKLLVVEAFLQQVHSGAQSLDAFYTLQAGDLVGGTGTLAGLGAGAQVSYRDIVCRTIDVSDNVGANILIGAVGMDAINAEAARLGLTSTQLNRYMMDYDAIESGVENYTSAADVAALLKMVHEGTFVDADMSALVLGALEGQQDWGGVRDGLPSGTGFAHKTGTLSSVYHDGGIVEGEHPLVIVVLCGGEGFYEGGAKGVMAQLASAAYQDLVAATQ